MKNKFYLLAALASVLIIGGGIYAYTFTTGLTLINIAEPTADVATSNETPTQPDWDDVLDPVGSSETLRPNEAGDECNITNEAGESCPNHYMNVDEVTSDDDTTTVYAKDFTTWERDLYNINNHSVGVGTINEVTVYARAIGADTPTQASLGIVLKSGNTTSESANQTITTSWANYSNTWYTNPDTGSDFTWAEIDSLQAGVTLRACAAGKESWVTQVWVVVIWEAPAISGSTPTGDLFYVTPHADYSGNLSVKVYLLNTGDLTKAYEYLNMELYLEDSVEAGETPNYQLLTLDEEVATFLMNDIVSGNHTLSVTGGTYELRSRDPNEWASGYTVTPELYCEVTQR